MLAVGTNVLVYAHRREASEHHAAADVSQIDAWLSSPSVRLLAETTGFAALLARFVKRPRVRGAVVHDARVAAPCVAHGVDALLTRDRDFSLFSELRTKNPFA